MLSIGATSASKASEATTRLEEAVFTAVILPSLRNHGCVCSGLELLEATVWIPTDLFYMTAQRLNLTPQFQLLKILNPTAQARNHCSPQLPER